MTTPRVSSSPPMDTNDSEVNDVPEKEIKTVITRMINKINEDMNMNLDEIPRQHI
jgi:hypothetical protein